MSHYKEREEKVCLNCNAELLGRFCHQCGQENREPRLTAWGLITHFFSDLTHFDGKFFSSTGKLISRPGFLPKEYIHGRRASYLDPIRMYIFSSAIFFLILFSVYHVGGINESDKKEVLAAVDSTLVKDAATVNKSSKDNTNVNFSLSKVPYATKEAYDSAQQALPENLRDGWFNRRRTLRTIELNHRMEQNRNQFWKDIISKFIHSFPYLLFVSLPLYALYLKLLYIRRKKYYYVDHGIFLIFLYIFTFIFLLALIGIDQLQEATNWGWLDVILTVMFCWGLYYAWRAMHKFYGQGKFKTFLKFALLNLMCLVSLIVLFGLFFLLTVFSI